MRARKGQKNKNKDQDAVAAKAKVVRDTKNIPNLIFKIEAFEKDLIRLIPKCKKNLLDKVKLSTARDFRFKLEEVQEDENNENTANHDEDTEMSILDDNAQAESTRIHSSQANSVLSSQNSTINSSQDETPEPPPKKLKVKMNFSKISKWKCNI